MSRVNSAKEFRRYFMEYASSATDTSSYLQPTVWGSNDTLGAASALLQRVIYVLGQDVSDEVEQHHPLVSWKCVRYAPGQCTRQGFIYDGYTETPLTIQNCIAEIVKAKRETRQTARSFPMVLLFQDSHYAALGHLEAFQDNDSSDRKLSQSAQQYETADPWNPYEWDDSVEQIRKQLEGPTMHHDRKLEIHSILKWGGRRVPELLGFLVNTASQLTHTEQAQLITANLTDDSIRTELMQQFQVSAPVLAQWQGYWQHKETHTESSPSPSPQPKLDTSGSEYLPSPSTSGQEEGDGASDNQEADQRLTGRSKRMHQTTPDMRVREHDRVVNPHNRAVPHKKQQKEPLARPLVTQFDEAATEEKHKALKLSAPSWQVKWNALADTWSTATRIPFPDTAATQEVWVEAAKHETELLLECIQTFDNQTQSYIECHQKRKLYSQQDGGSNVRYQRSKHGKPAPTTDIPKLGLGPGRTKSTCN
ncbi:unnamed protein product [Phytophthora fragariaefolia]|uniref:Unnamed protein product n=1 Tax=Phytophthora fragariaefolia TaxID=1490495 RepID=A0A9W7D0K8_9STRA|nr:unnamed protein product [Phytophthora fragariaefolia]